LIEVFRIKPSLAASSRTETLGYRYTRKNLHQSHYVGDGTITIHTNSKILKDYNPEAQGDARRSEILEVFEGAIIYLPNSVPNTRICVSFQQRSTYEGSLLGKPTISFSATLPDNSEVFLRIKDGDKKGLLKLFAEGAASFWDRDSIGRSLLNVRSSAVFSNFEEAILTTVVCLHIPITGYLPISFSTWC